MIFLQVEPIMFTSPQTISAIAHVSIAVIALANVIIACYIIHYQKKQDTRRQRIDKQNLRIDWFKNLIIQPQWGNVENYYKEITDICKDFNNQNLSDEDKAEILKKIKKCNSNVRKSFVDTLKVANEQLQAKAQQNLDKLIDGITEIVQNEGINLSHKPTFDREILNRITYSRNDLISIIFSYKGE